MVVVVGLARGQNISCIYYISYATFTLGKVSYIEEDIYARI